MKKKMIFIISQREIILYKTLFVFILNYLDNVNSDYNLKSKNG